MKQVKEKKKHKAVIKEKRSKGLLPEKKQPVQEEDSEDEEDEDYEDVDDEEDESGDDADGLLDVEAEETGDDESDEEEEGAMTAAAMMNESGTDSESEVDMEEKIVRPKKSILKKAETQPKKDKKEKAAKNNEDGEDQENDDDEESDIALSDLEGELNEEDREDLYVKTRLSINNQPALLAAVKRISIPKDKSVPFATHQTVVSSEATASKIEDISDDLNRELQLYAQSLEAAKKARSLLRAEGAPFSRPKDYFAEMVKDDGHMQKVKDKLVEDATAKKASAEARKLRDLKKFGKQVQVAKLQERQKEKKDTLEKIKELKKSMSHLFATHANPLVFLPHRDSPSSKPYVY